MQAANRAAGVRGIWLAFRIASALSRTCAPWYALFEERWRSARSASTFASGVWSPPTVPRPA